MKNSLTILALACLATLCLGAINRHRRQVATLCPRADGRYPVEGNCRQFIECENGAPEMRDCPGRLVFNPQTQLCDRAGEVSGCQNQGNPSDSLCDANPGIEGEAWKVAHPNFCNAFYTCESHYIHRRCEFCGEGTYFSQNNGHCERIPEGNTPAECTQKQLVPHSQKSILEVYPDCNLFRNNPFQRLLARIESQNGNVGPVQNNLNPVPVPVITQTQQLGQQVGQPLVLLNPFPTAILAPRGYLWN